MAIYNVHVHVHVCVIVHVPKGIYCAMPYTGPWEAGVLLCYFISIMMINYGVFFTRHVVFPHFFHSFFLQIAILNSPMALMHLAKVAQNWHIYLTMQSGI